MSENEFKIRRVTYIAVIEESCDGCAFDYMSEKCLSSPPCAKEQRSDGLNVIFVEENNDRLQQHEGRRVRAAAW